MLWVFGTALLVRLCMALWIVSGIHVLRDSAMVADYFERGYALSAGWGYVHAVADLPANVIDPLKVLKARVDAHELNASPESVELAPARLVESFALHPPGLPLLIAGLHRTFGGPVDLHVRVLGALLDSLAAVVVWRVGSQWLGQAVGLYAGMAYALFLPTAYASVCNLPDGMFSLFVAGSLLLATRCLKASRRKAAGYAAAAGLVLGIGSYFRPDYVLLPAAMFLGFWLCTKHLLRSVAWALTMQLAVAAALAPWAWRNYEQFDRWIFTSTSPGATLIGGLGAFQNPWGFQAPDAHRFQLAREAGLGNPFSPEADMHFRQLFWSSVREHPVAYAGSVVRRLPLALFPPASWGYDNPAKGSSFADLRASGVDRYQAITRHARYILAAYWDVVLVSVAFAAMTVCVLVMVWRERRHWPIIVLLMVPHLYSIASHALVHVEPRYMLPSIFCWVLAAGYVIALRVGHPVGRDAATANVLQPEVSRP